MVMLGRCARPTLYAPPPERARQARHARNKAPRWGLTWRRPPGFVLEGSLYGL